MTTAAAAETKSVSLVNISTEKWPPRHRTYFGSIEVQSPQAGEPYAITPVRGCTAVMDLGDKRTMPIQIPAREIAEDLAREINGDSGEGSFHGVFVAAGPEPTEAELTDARRRLEEFQRRLVAAADLEWERTKNPMFITDLERRAARQLGLEKPWLYDAKPLAECPVCAEKIKPAWPFANPVAPSSTAKKPRSTAWARLGGRAEKDPTQPWNQMGQGSRRSSRGTIYRGPANPIAQALLPVHFFACKLRKTL